MEKYHNDQTIFACLDYFGRHIIASNKLNISRGCSKEINVFAIVLKHFNIVLLTANLVLFCLIVSQHRINLNFQHNPSTVLQIFVDVNSTWFSKTNSKRRVNYRFESWAIKFLDCGYFCHSGGISVLLVGKENLITVESFHETIASYSDGFSLIKLINEKFIGFYAACFSFLQSLLNCGLLVNAHGNSIQGGFFCSSFW